MLSRAVVVVEAGPRSGSLNTASWAREHNVDVYTVPGPIGREASIGTNALLFDGAKMVTSVRDILEGLPWRVSRIARSLAEPAGAPSGSRLGDRIYDILGPVALHIDHIARSAGCPASSALPVLVELELQGLVRQFPGKRFARAQIRTG
jgi:DNA processing protein